MKKVSLFGIAAVVGCVSFTDVAMARNMYSSINMRNADGDIISINRGISDDAKYARHMTVRPGTYDSVEYKESEKQGKTYQSAVRRKYFIANPFYQPMKGGFGTVTTGEYMEGSYKFDDIDRTLSEWSVKEDISYGITDSISFQAMARYNTYKLTWENDEGKDDYKSDGLNLYGFGIQGRIVDTPEWISTLSGYYEHQKHGVDYFIADIKAGYKVARTTIYGLGRAWLMNMEGDIYGEYIADDPLSVAVPEWSVLVYSDAGKNIFMGEMGMGVWSVLDEDWTLNVEGVFGLYDWHNQLSVKGAFGWQPNDYFALNLYAKTSVYDSANDKDLEFHWGTLPMTAEQFFDPNYITSVDISKYQEWSVGLQVMFQF